MDDRRKWPRFIPVDAMATVIDASGEERAARVLNESIGGAAFTCAAGDAPIPGTIVHVVLRDATLSAIVWHSRSQPDGTIAFGVEWLDEPAP